MAKSTRFFEPQSICGSSASSNKRFSNLHQTHKSSLHNHTINTPKPYLITIQETPLNPASPKQVDPVHGNIISHCNWVLIFLSWKLGNFHGWWRLRCHGGKNRTQPGSNWEPLKIWPDDGKRQWRKRALCPISCHHS